MLKLGLLLLTTATYQHRTSAFISVRPSAAAHPLSAVMSQAATPTTAASALNFLNLVGLLKQLKRSGWVREGVHLPESVADHQYRMGVMAMLIGEDAGVDKHR
jgi:HD domain